MNILSTLFILLAYGLFVAMYNGGDNANSVFPLFNPPTVPSFQQGSCNWWVFCANVLADWVGLIAQGIIYVASLIIEIIRVLVAVITLIVSNAFTGFNGAPFWVNGMFTAGIGGSLIISIYKSIRKGDTDDS